VGDSRLSPASRHPVAAIHGLTASAVGGRTSDPPRLREPSRPFVTGIPPPPAWCVELRRCGWVSSGSFVGAVGFGLRAASAAAMFWKDSGSRSSSASGRDQSGVGPFGQVRVLVVGDSGAPFATCPGKLEHDAWRELRESGNTIVHCPFECAVRKFRMLHTFKSFRMVEL
jgi:hypothetical protein